MSKRRQTISRTPRRSSRTSRQPKTVIGPDGSAPRSTKVATGSAKGAQGAGRRGSGVCRVSSGVVQGSSGVVQGSSGEYLSGLDSDLAGLPPSALTRTKVYRRIPQPQRGRIDAAILLRPPECSTLKAIAQRFEIRKQYGLSYDSLEYYASRLEEFVRPAMTAQVMAGILGCLPERYRRQVFTGSQVLLVSKVLNLINNTDSNATLTVAELAKLATVLASAAGNARTRDGSPKNNQLPLSDDPAAPSDDQPAPADASRLSAAVRMVYGLGLPNQDALPNQNEVTNQDVNESPSNISERSKP